MKKLKEIGKNKWVKYLGNTYVIILILFIVWMLFFDTNSYLIHSELNDDIKALEENAEFYQQEIDKDTEFIEKMEDSNEIERYAREKYYLKRENEDIFIIEDADSLKTDTENE
ncbi:FtsB family cell division protein [Aureitalea marina]|uniref:Septum formation initiator n=1 Tax=Aureitalea marina TaxID=930804 RepID=A0A2S7KPX7_9FLAO|nr:septum formation initiator family protein [Aureitalea marina]PQB04682.1 septum formation initiator [Aureitalea marina]